MNQIKTFSQSQPIIETINNEKAVIGLEDGTIVVAYLTDNKVLSYKLDEQPVQVAQHKSSIYVLTKPYPVQVIYNEDGEAENEELLAINMLAAKKTGITLWQLGIQNNELSVINKREKTGGFTIHNDKLYACDPIKEGFYVLDLMLKEIERVGIKIEPTKRKPWFSSIFIIDEILYLLQEDGLIRWFRINKSIDEGGILTPENHHESYFISINNVPKRLIKAGNYVIGTLDSSPSYLIDFKNNTPYIVDNPHDFIDLKYKELYTFSKNIQASTQQYAIANDRYVISIADAKIKQIEYAFSILEDGDNLNITRITVYNNYAICFAWTYERKYPVIVFDMTHLKDPKINMLINFGGDVDNLTIDEDLD